MNSAIYLRRCKPSYCSLLQEREYDRSGSPPRKADVRVSGCNESHLAITVAKGDFREDLFYA